MKTNIELRSNRPSLLASAWHGLFTLVCLLCTLAGSSLSAPAGVVRGITVQPSYCPGATVRVEGRGWVAGEEVTIDFQPSGDVFTATADNNGNFLVDTITLTGDDGGTTFTATATNDSGDENTQNFDVNSPPTLDALSDQEACEGDTVVFTVFANGTGPFTYQWFKNGNAISGETFDTLFLDGVSPADDGSSFSVEVTGACGTESTGALLFVNALISTSELGNQVVCAGSQTTFSTTTSGSGPFSYVWFKDNIEIPGRNDSFLDLFDTQPGDAGTYTVQVIGNCNVVSSSATLTVNEAPSISALNDQTVCVGETVMLSTTATGTAPLTFTWYQDNDVIPGATDSTLVLSSVTMGNGGTYTVVVANDCGSVSSSARLTVNKTTSASSLANLTKCAGESATFSTVASGAEPISYQWFFNDAPISEATGSSYTLNAVAAENAGAYCVIVSGRCGSVTNCATLTVATNTTMTSLANASACEGADVVFSTTPSGTGPFTFVWKKDDMTINGATGNSLVLSGVATTDAGTYSVEVSGKCNTVASSALLTVSTNTAATALAAATVCPGGTATFSTTASGTGLPTEFIVENDSGSQIVQGEMFNFVWRKDGVLLEGQTNSSLTISNITPAETGTYCVEVSGLCNTVTNCATLAISTGTVISGLGDQSACPNSTVTFAAQVAGAGPFTYLWKKDGNAINDETNSSLTLLNVSAADAGAYSVDVTGACDSASSSAQLTVLEITAIADLMSLTKQTGETAVFSTTLSGTGPFTIVWKHDGNVIPGETGPTLTISPVTVADAGTYTIEVSGACLPPVLLNIPNLAAAASTGPATSSATLTIDCTITATPLASQDVAAGANVLFGTVASGSGPFTFVWKHNGSVLSGQTGSTLALNNVGALAAGEYCVEVTGACAAVTNCAMLVVRGDNVNVTPIVDPEVCEGANASFSTTASGAASFSYAWRKDGMLIPGATGSTLSINNAQLSDAGIYCVEVTWLTGSITSCAPLTVKSPTTATIQGIEMQECHLSSPQEQAESGFSMTIVEGYPACELRTTLAHVPSGGTVHDGTYLGWCIDYSSLISRDTIYTPTMYLSTGTLPPSLQNPNWSYVNYILNHKHGTSIDIQNAIWHFIGGPVPSNDPDYYPASQTALDMIDDATSNGGDFMPGPGQIMAVVLDMGGNVQNNIIEVRCPGYAEDCEGEIAVICVKAGGTGPFTYQWYKDGVAIQGENAECLEIDPATSDDSGVYTVTVTGACGSATATAGLVIHDSVSVEILAANSIHHHDERECPVEVNLCLSEQGAVYALVNGGGTYSYEWYRNGVLLPCNTCDLHFNNVTANDAGNYTVKVRGACDDTTRCFTVNVRQPVRLALLQDIYACQDGYVSIDAIVTGDGPFTYIWKHNGIVLPGETNSSLVFIQVSSFDAGQYTVEIIGSCNYVISSMNLVIRTRTEITPLAGQTVCEGEPAEFGTETAGTGPFQFVWLKNGQVLPGQNGLSLAIPSAKPEDSGTYTICVIGPCNNVTNSATLTVKALAHVIQLADQAACLGEAATFTAQVTGTGPLSYVWKKGNQVIAGQNGNTLTVAHCTANDAGVYTVEVTGPCNMTSASATLVINVQTDIAALANRTVCEDDAVTFSTTATGTGPHSFIWKKNGNVLAGQNNNSLKIAHAGTADAGAYTVEVHGLCNTVSSSATLVVNQKTAVAALGNKTSCIGETVVFSAVGTGTGPLTYVWHKDGAVLAGQHESTLVIDGAAETDAGQYSVEVQGVCNSATASATLTINALTEITALSNATKCLGESVTFSVTASGTGPFSYLWKKDGSVLPGQTNHTLTIAAVAQADAGSYEIEVTGACGSVKKSASLTINTPLQIVSLPRVERCVGESVTFNPGVTGSGPLTFSWIKNGMAVPSETNATCTLHAVTAADSGYYTVIVTGPCNTMRSDTMLVVNLPVTATALSAQTKCAGESLMLGTTASGTGPITYVWRKDGNVLAGKTGSSITIASLTTADAGLYSVEVKGTCNSVTNRAVIGVNTPITATALANVTKCEGEIAIFSTTASGTGPISYIWRKDGVIVPGQTAGELRINPARPGDAGTYSVEVLGACNSVTRSATLTVNALTAVTPLASQTNCVGATITFATSVTGGSPTLIVWRKDGSILAGQTNSTLVLTNVTTANAGLYTVEVTGPCNTATSGATLALGTCMIESIKKLGDTVEVRMKGATGRTYALECSFDLLHWQQIGTQLDLTGVMTFTDSNNHGTQMKFYRAVLLP